MAVFVTGYVVIDVLDVYRAFDRAFLAAQRYNAAARRSRRRLPAAAIEAELRASLLEFQRGLDRAAAIGASTAQKAMREQLQLTAVRPETSSRPHLKTLLTARPAAPPGVRIATGSVGVGEISRLDRAIDPDHPESGPYWRAQEYGTRKHVGRRIYGYFFGGGVAPDRPRAIYRGPGRGPHAEFASTRGANSTFLGPRGGSGGPGRIRTPLKPRNFIRDGAAQGGVAWLAEVRAAEAAALSRLARIGR